jgi:hypothetical protein
MKAPFYRRTLFWDVPEDQIDWDAHRDWIIARVLAFGDISEVVAVTRLYGKEAVLEVIRAGRVPERVGALWSKIETLEDERMHEETMLPETRAALRAVAPVVRARPFMLAGGTAVAVRLGHRRSQDLAFFTAEPFDAAQLNAVLQDGVADSPSKVAPDTLHTSIRGVRVSFLRQRDVRLSADAEVDGVPVADLGTLLALKLNALSSRGDRKDFIDVYAICRHAGLGGRELLEFAERRLPGLDRTHLLMSLSYFEDAERTPMPEMLAGWSWEEVRRFFEEEAERVLRSEMRRDGLL